MEVQEILFGSLEPREKLEQIKQIPANDLLSYGMIDIMKRIIEECGGEKKEFRIKNERRAGNNWNSTVKGIRLYNGWVMVDVYVQNSSTDTNTSEYYSDLLTGTEKGWVDSRLGYCSYYWKDKARVVRSILSEYVYYKYLEVDERERANRVAELSHYSIINPIHNHYYNEWRLKYIPTYRSDPRRERYHRCEKVLCEYIKEHADELYGKPNEELTEIYHKVWQEEAKM